MYTPATLPPHRLSEIKKARVHTWEETYGFCVSFSFFRFGWGYEACVRSIENSGRVNLPCSIHYEFQQLV